MNAEQIADHFTYIDSQLFVEIERKELFHLNFLSAQKGPMFAAMASRLNQWTRWIVTEVLRVLLFFFFILFFIFYFILFYFYFYFYFFISFFYFYFYFNLLFQILYWKYFLIFNLFSIKKKKRLQSKKIEQKKFHCG